jgi:hypothetical protein
MGWAYSTLRSGEKYIKLWSGNLKERDYIKNMDVDEIYTFSAPLNVKK